LEMMSHQVPPLTSGKTTYRAITFLQMTKGPQLPYWFLSITVFKRSWMLTAWMKIWKKKKTKRHPCSNTRAILQTQHKNLTTLVTFLFKPQLPSYKKTLDHAPWATKVALEQSLMPPSGASHTSKIRMRRNCSKTQSITCRSRRL